MSSTFTGKINGNMYVSLVSAVPTFHVLLQSCFDSQWDTHQD